MAEGTVEKVTQFSLGEELPPLSVSVSSSSDEVEEEPLLKKPRVDQDTSDTLPPSPLHSESEKTAEVPSQDLDEDRLKNQVGENSDTEGTDESDGNSAKPVKKEKVRKKRKLKESRSESEDGESDLEKKTSSNGEKGTKKKKNKGSHLRKNIRDILKSDQLDEQTIEAQREEQERRARMNEKLQMQQQRNLLEMLTSGTGSTPLGSHNIDKLLARKGLSISQGGIPSSSKSLPSPSTAAIIDEVTLSSDDEQPDMIPLVDGGLGSSRNGFRFSGGEVRTGDGVKIDDGSGGVVDSDSDDCVVLSPSQYQDEGDKEGKEDENNFPDELGRVLINVAHPPADPDIFLPPQIARNVKPHQIGGIRFLYDNVVESLDRFSTSNGFGCILAHSMGLGKTIQAISFCDVFLRHTRGKKVLIIVPINTIQNWVNEFDMWVPSEDPNPYCKLERKMKGKGSRKFKSMGENSSDQVSQSSPSLPDPSQPAEGDEETSSSVHTTDSGGSNTSRDGEIRPRNFQVYVLGETVKTLSGREKIISEWHFKGGVLLLGYEMFRMLALKRLKKSSKKKMANCSFTAEGLHNQQMEEQSLERIYEYMVKPGPDLIICDEGHRIKNSGASISQALKAIGTRRRVVLTGYPLQNNLMEYWCMVDFVRPNYLGSKTEFSNMFERPITNGQCVDSSKEDKKIMRYRSHVLHTLLEGFVQRRSHSVLQSALPFKEEWVFLLKMTPIQYDLYKEFISYLKEEHRDKNSDREGSPTANPIKAFAVCCKIWNHPDALYNVVKKHEDVLEDLDLDDVDRNDTKKTRKPRKNAKIPAPPMSSSFPGNIPDFNSSFNPDFYGLGADSMANIPTTVAQVNSTTDGRSIRLEWAVPVFKNYEAEVLENGVKFQILFAILEEIQIVGDRLLVFSQSLLTLDLIELFLAKRLQWKKNVHYFRLDGSTSALEREKLITDFNAKDGVHLFLVSTRAGSLGINLIGANRVVVFDASWNPCHDAQAVCRVYRYGQKKECQIYRFVTDCSLEKRIYDRQINKRGMADRVVDEMNPETHLNTKDVSSFLVLDHGQMEEAQKQDLSQNFNMSKFTDPVLRNVLLRCGDRLTREPFEHESLLIDRKETKLSAKEKRQARQNYEMEKRQASQSGFGSGYTYTRPSYAQYYPKQNNDSPLLPSSLNYSDFNSSYSSSVNRASFDKSSSFRDKMLELQMQQQRRIEDQKRRVEEQKRELNYSMLKERGIDCRFMILKRDAYLQDPSGGQEIFLHAGEKINIFRTSQGTYVRAGKDRFIGIKPTGNNNVFHGVPLTGDVSSEQLQSLVYSLLRPAQKKPAFYNPYLNQHSRNSSTEVKNQWPMTGNFSKPPPTMQKLPPTSGIFPNFQNHQLLGNFKGGDMAMMRKNNSTRKPIAETNSKNSNGSNSGSDIEIIEFDEHFGETLQQQQRSEDIPLKPKVAPNSPLSSSSQQLRSGSTLLPSSKSLRKALSVLPELPTPDMSITPILQSNSIVDLASDNNFSARQQNLMEHPPASSSLDGGSNNAFGESSLPLGFGSACDSVSIQSAADEALDCLLRSTTSSRNGKGQADLPLSVVNMNPNKDGTAWSAAGSSNASTPGFPDNFHNSSVYYPSLALQNLLQNFGSSGRMNHGFGDFSNACKSSSDLPLPDFRHLFDGGNSTSSNSNEDDHVRKSSTGNGSSLFDKIDFPIAATSSGNNNVGLQSLNMPGQYYDGNVHETSGNESNNFNDLFQ